MYERMLDNSITPSLAEMTVHYGDSAPFFTALNEWLSDSFALEQKIVFPYGNKYGWGIAHRRKAKLICNVFPECGAFSVMTHLSEAQFQSVYALLSEYAQQHVDHKYPCGDGGWVHFRVTCQAHLSDIQLLLTAKMNKPSASKKGGR